ncbi:DUF2092 domain-containing protein [Glaciimonas soli]|uniref:DUF2092 domain-containing protein n=1 Tax=Glaciimonas soli TaxID=2590999 RepID=A0A843YNG6_9BURK|nr:DUF2092 domain-containing protein [Glaciimonas soli]MQR01005.1 DUF2092 domain-containing protein [Glaciimonas soli]
MDRMPLTIRSLLAIAASCFSLTCVAQEAPAAPAIDPNVIKALDNMGEYLRTLNTFEIRTASVTDALLGDDQTAQYGSTAILKVHRPNQLQADTTNDRGDHKLLYYNGRTTTVYGPDTKFYATVQAPPTLKDLVQVLAQKYGIEVPLTDLFYWGTEKISTSDIKSADYLGEALVDGHSTSHYAIREKDIDWQIWIDNGNKPLPRKMVITTTSEKTHPQHATLIRWDLTPSFAAGTFDFKAPAGSHRIAIETADGKIDSVDH